MNSFVLVNGLSLFNNSSYNLNWIKIPYIHSAFGQAQVVVVNLFSNNNLII